jgi:hypothetical protein
MFYVITIRIIPFCTKIIFTNLINCLLFFSLKIFKFEIFSIFFLFSFLFLPFLLLLSFLLLFFSLTISSSLTYRTLSRTSRGAATELLHSSPPWRPSCTLPMPPLSLSLSLYPFPLLPLSGDSRLPWRASHKLVFLCGMTKTDAHDPLLQSPPSILSEMNSNLRILCDFIFQLNSDFYL